MMMEISENNRMIQIDSEESRQPFWETLSKKLSLYAQQQLIPLFQCILMSFDSYWRFNPTVGLNSSYSCTFINVPNLDPLSFIKSCLFLYDMVQWLRLTLISFITTVELLFRPMVISSEPSPIKNTEKRLFSVSRSTYWKIAYGGLGAFSKLSRMYFLPSQVNSGWQDSWQISHLVSWYEKKRVLLCYRFSTLLLIQSLRQAQWIYLTLPEHLQRQTRGFYLSWAVSKQILHWFSEVKLLLSEMLLTQASSCMYMLCDLKSFSVSSFYSSTISFNWSFTLPILTRTPISRGCYSPCARTLHRDLSLVGELSNLMHQLSILTVQMGVWGEGFDWQMRFSPSWTIQVLVVMIQLAMMRLSEELKSKSSWDWVSPASIVMQISRLLADCPI